MVKNLTEGRPLKLLFFFAMPMVLGNIFQQLYNMVDSMVVGKFVGEDALAAVGSSFPIVFLAVAIATGLSMGCTVVISQLFGAGQIIEMKTTIYTALITLTIVGVGIMALGEVLSLPLLKLLGTDPDVMADSILYLRIYFGGAVFLFLYNTLNGIYNALGDSNTPLKFLTIASVMNVALDLVFVIYFKMGVAGVAWATLISQGFCAVISFFVLMNRIKIMDNEPEYLNKKPDIYRRSAVAKILRVGIPSIVQQSIVSFSMMAMQGLVNSYGKVFVAGYTASTKIDTLAMMPNLNFANAMSSYTAQNIGAKKNERVISGYKASILMVFIYSVIITGIIFMFGTPIMGLFLDNGTTGSAMSYGLSYIKTVSVFYPVMGVMFVSNGLLRGAGDMKSFLVSSMVNLFSRIIIAYTMSHFIGEAAIWWSIPIGWCIGAVISFICIKKGKWKEKAIIK